MTIKVIIDARRAVADGKYPVKLSFANFGKTVFVSLGISVHAMEFDEKSFVLTPINKADKIEYQRYNILIQNELSRARNLLLSLQVENRDNISPSKFKDMFSSNKTPSGKTTFNYYFRTFIDNKEGRTKEIYQVTLNKIEKYFGKNLMFDDVDFSLLETFDRKMRTEKFYNKDAEVIKVGLQTNARAIHMRNIRAVFNRAIDDSVIDLNLYPFRRFKIEKERTRKRAISSSSIKAIFEYSGNEVEDWAVDMAKLIFYLIGINTIDLYNLNEYDGDYIHYKRAKTGSLYSIKVVDEAKVLLNKYKGVNDLLCFKEQFRLSHSFMDKINKYLKDICEELNIPPITTYTLRHTWATIAAELEIPKETIAAALGHAQNSVTDVYINFNQKKVDEANRKVIDYVFGIEKKTKAGRSNTSKGNNKQNP